MGGLRFTISITALLQVFSGLPNTLLAQSLKTPEFQERAIKGFDHVYSLQLPTGLEWRELRRFTQYGPGLSEEALPSSQVT